VTLIQKVKYILSPLQKKQAIILAALLFLGMIFELAGLGILIPVLGLILNSDIGNDYPALQPYIRALGNPTHLQLVLWAMVILVFFYLIKAVYLVFLNWRQSKFSTSLSSDLANKLFLGYLRQPYTFHLQRNSAELIRNIVTEVPQFGILSAAIINLTLEISIIFGTSIFLVFAEPVGSLSVIIFLGVSVYAYHRFANKQALILGDMRQYHNLLSYKHLNQGLAGVKDVKILGKEFYFLKEYKIHNSASFNILMKSQILSLIPRAYLELLAVTGLATLISLMLLQGKPLGQMLPTLGIFVAAAFRMIPSVNKIMSYLQTIRFSRPVVETIYQEFLLFQKTNDSLILHSEEFQFSHDIEIKNLTFAYENANTNSLNDVSLKINKGKSIGLIGKSGSGKSTLVDSILGLLSPQSGEICVDNINIEENLRGWQNLIGYVPQTIYLIDDTIRKNIAFGVEEDKIDDSAVANAIIAAQLDLFTKDLPEGLNTFVGERGVRLSGGQRQRIGIARALYNNPHVLVLDEATSALDSATERGVMESVAALKGNKTIIIIAHRLSTLEQCDWIYQLQDGKISQIVHSNNVLGLNFKEGSN
jgi:ABC-type multidrug transport system fused ATPase/permease subunit